MAAPLDLNLLKTFVAVVESGSLSNAAPRVGRSQSAVSMQMQRLEEMVGNQLLVRGPRTVTPNAIGEDFLIYARRLLKLSDEAWASVTRPKETGSVRLGVPDDYAVELKKAGYDFNAGQLTRLRFSGVPADYAVALAVPDRKMLTSEQIIDLRMRGVDAETARTLRQ